MYGILRDKQFILSSGISNERFRIYSSGDFVYRDNYIWDNVKDSRNPFATEYRWNARLKIEEIMKYYPFYEFSKFEIIEFDRQFLEDCVFNKLKA